uniref:DNA-directed RNA polymerase n=1 Tax=Aegilops tauschii TaxID=37682 RepID=M8CI87_AEGTA
MVGDPKFRLHEIGIPMDLASKLHVSEYVNSYNFDNINSKCNLHLLAKEELLIKRNGKRILVKEANQLLFSMLLPSDLNFSIDPKNGLSGLSSVMFKEYGDAALKFLSSAQDVLSEFSTMRGFSVCLSDIYLFSDHNSRKKLADEVNLALDDAKEAFHIEQLLLSPNSILYLKCYDDCADLSNAYEQSEFMQNNLSIIKSSIMAFKSVFNDLLKMVHQHMAKDNSMMVMINSRNVPGTLTRKLMYHLRDIYVAYDGTVRSSYGQQIVQFTYDTAEPGAPVGSWAASSISEAAYGALDHPVNSLEDSPLMNLQDVLKCQKGINYQDHFGLLFLSKNDESNSMSQLDSIKKWVIPSLLAIPVKGFLEFKDVEIQCHEDGELVVKVVMSEHCNKSGIFWATLQKSCVVIMALIDWERSRPGSVYDIFCSYGIDSAWKYFVESLRSKTDDIGRSIHRKHLLVVADCLSFYKCCKAIFSGLSLWYCRCKEPSTGTSGPFKIMYSGKAHTQIPNENIYDCLHSPEVQQVSGGAILNKMLHE